MPKNLIIVESPAKAKTIEGYLGAAYQVASCYGHIRDLPKSSKAIDVAHGFLPTYEISEGKQQIVKALKALAHQADCVYLASDDDREGESIAWHLKEALELNDAKTQRIVFREITKNAILNAPTECRNRPLNNLCSSFFRTIGATGYCPQYDKCIKFAPV